MNNHQLFSRWTPYTGSVRSSGTNTRKEANGGRCRSHHHGVRSCSSIRCRCLSETNTVNSRNIFDKLCTRSCILIVPKSSFLLQSYSSNLEIRQQFEYLRQKQYYTFDRSSPVVTSQTNSCTSSTSVGYIALRCLVFVLFTFQITVYLLTRYLLGILEMGNEGSAPSSQESTPISEYPSMYSIHSRVRSSVESTRAPSPMEAPEPDLSHLTAEEVAQIRSVMERAKHMQHEESTRARRLEEEYIDLATKIEREASLSELADTGVPLCPLCNKMELTLNQDGTRSSMNVCVDCEKMTCTRCGGYQKSVTRIQEWVCVVCDKRRRLMMTTGMWYHGYHPESELPLEKQIISGTTTERTRGLDNVMVSSMDASMTSSFSQTSSKDSRGSRESREDSDNTGGGGTSWEGSRCGGDSGLSLELSSLSAASSQNSELARHVYEQNRMKGPGATLPKSESDEFSDRTSDLDFDELASERSRVDGGSSTDESNKEATVTNVGSHKRHKHRPKSLSLSHSHSHTSSDEEDGSGGSDKKEESWTGDKRERRVKSKPHSSVSHLASESSLLSATSASLSAGLQKAKKLLTNNDDGGKVKGRDLASIQDLIDNHPVNSPTPPRSPSWREGLESPPFSPRRRDSYPGKRRGSLSPKEKNNHFTYTDISPPSRQLSLDELYGEPSTHSSDTNNGVAGSHAAQKPSPMSPDEMKGSFISTSGQTLVFDMPAVRAKPPVSISGPMTQHNDLYMSSTMAHTAPVMDLATYAATIANSTASLTSMSVSPTNLLPQSSHPPVAEPMSPDSADSVDSSCSSPVSPGYYDNAPPPSDEVEEVELADPSSKSIDFQGSKRQKARPPSTDWSPVIDLSPILDVSPSVEEAEQEDMLAKQMEELERQRSREEAAEDEYDDEESESGEARSLIESKSVGSTKKSAPQVIPRIPAPPSAKKLKQQLNEELDDYDIDDVETPEDVGPYLYGSSLKRCGNFEDISRLGSDNSLIKHTSELLSSDRLVDDIDLNDASSDLPFFSCTTQSQSLSHNTPGTSTTVSSLHAPGKFLPEKAAEEQGTKRSRDMESLITDEFHKVAEDMENIVKRGAMDVKPIPPPKPKRRLPDPDLLTSPPPTKGSFDGPEKRQCPSIRTEEFVDTSSSIDSSFDEAHTGKYLPRQDSTERKKAKDMKAKPSPILVQYIEAEEQSVSPHYRVMESPPTPETKTIKREFSDSTSVSPNSSPDQDVYAFPSPVTPPDSDSSPPKPHSPSSPVTDLDEDSSIIASGVMNPYRASSPYDNAKSTPSHKPRRTSPSLGTLQAVSSSSKSDQLTTAKPEVMRPPISPRKSIRKFDDQNINGRSSPVYENVKDLTTQEYLKEQQKHASLLNGNSEIAASLKGLTRMGALSKGLGTQYTTQPAEIITYPVAEEFSGRKRSSSAPSTELQDAPQPAQRPEPALRPRSASVEYEQEPNLERVPSVRDKIRAFEEPPVPRKRIANKPREVAHEKPEPKAETRREGQVMKDKRTDSGSSTSSSGSSAKTSSSRSSSDLSRHSQGKESPQNGKKIRRKLPPIPVGEKPIVAPKSKVKRVKPPTVKRGEGVDKDEAPASVGADSRRVQYQSSNSSESEGYFVGPSNRISRTQMRDSDESMNEDDMEVARLTTLRAETQAPKRKTHLVEVGKSKSLDSAESISRSDAAEAARVKPHIQRTTSLAYGPKDETDEFIDSLIDIYGIPCTEAMKSLKKRLQEELRRVTKDRKRKLEELEEIRALQMQIGALKSESDAYARSRAFAGKRSPAQHLMVEPQPDTRKKTGVTQSASSSSSTPRSSPQVTPRRQRHKRQSSDPMISKFSPIKEDKDIEGDFQTRVHEPSDSTTLKYHTDDSSQSGISDSESTRSEPVREAHYFKPDSSDYARAFYTQRSDHGGSGEKIHYTGYDHGRYDRAQAMSGSRSEQQLSSRSRTSVFYLDDEETKAREDKKAMLQYEIMKRKQQLEETARLKNELLKLARARQSLAHSYDDIPRQYGAPVAPHRNVPRGIIKPIDDESHLVYDYRADNGRRSREHSRDRSRERSAERRSEGDLHLSSFREEALDSMVMSEHRYRDTSRRHHSHHAPQSQEAKALSNYSSTEYLAHKQESASRRYIEEPGQYGSQGWIAGDYPTDGLSSTQAYSQPALNKRADSSQSLSVTRRESSKKDAGIVSSVTLPNIYADRAERDFRPSYRDTGFVSTSISDTDGSPASDITPAMPLLDDVKIKSRTIIRNIGSGSRPVSAEFCAGEVEDLLNAMYRVESDNSVDADEPIMKHMTEGGVTILKQIDRKRRPAPVEPYRYSFPVKRILVTRDAKDKSITGNGLGMKIVGGKQIPGAKEVGAFVTAIYPIIADQLHGELDVGDQVLEWNGIHLTGLSAQEVQDIIAQTNGEIEMVVRAQAVPVSLMELTAQPESCRSSYDNLALPTYEDSVKEPPLQKQRAAPVPTVSRQGVDPRQLAAQLEGIREAVSPAEDSPSSSHQDVATPSVSSPCSTPRSDPTSTSSDRQQRPASGLATGSGEKTDRNTDKSDPHTGRRRHRHSPNPDQTQHPHHSHRQPAHQHHPATTQPQQHHHHHHHHHHHQQQQHHPNPQESQQLPSEPDSAQSHHSERDTLPAERVPPSRRKTERRKQQDAVSLPNVPEPEKPASLVDPVDESACSSPALNDRLRASPPLDTRRSMKTRPARKGKDMYCAPPKSPPQEIEPGEDCGLGAIQLQISHDDFDNTLNVHVIQARNLRPRDLNGLSDPFVKLYLLPGRGQENKRRTKHIPRTLNPEWHQTVMFQDVARLELQNKVLEVTVWDYDRFKTNDFLGELIIELREFAFLDNKPHWYPLKEHVVIQSFELPKSTVPPPKPADNGRPKSKSPRHGKKHGVSSLQLPDSPDKEAGSNHRRQSLGTITGNGANETSTSTRQISSATNSPTPVRRPRGTKSPIKTKSNGLLYR